MLDKCANPACNTPVHCLQRGRLYALYRCKKADGQKGRNRASIEFYWLCGPCSDSLRLQFTGGRPELIQQKA